MTELRIKIKETISEVQPLSNAEIFIIDLFYSCNKLPCKQATEIRNNINSYFNENCFTFNMDTKTKTVHTETIRDATEKEIDAWFALWRLNRPSHHCINFDYNGFGIERMTIEDAKEILKGKEIILELI